MMLLLRLLADQGRTVVLTTHAISHVDVCDNLVLVGPGGYVIYAGRPDDAPEWFGVPSLGDVFSLVENPEASSEAAQRLAERDAKENADALRVAIAPVVSSSPVATEGAVGIARPASVRRRGARHCSIRVESSPGATSSCSLATERRWRLVCSRVSPWLS